MTVLARWDPFREFSTMQDRMNRMNRLFRESYSPEGPEEALTTTSFAPPVDIYEDEHTIALKMEVQGTQSWWLMTSQAFVRASRCCWTRPGTTCPLHGTVLL